MGLFGRSRTRRSREINEEKYAAPRRGINAVAIGTLLLATAALILGFFCLFAGHTKGFMPTTAILTLNTSRVGENLLNSSASSSSGGILGELSGEINKIEGEIDAEFGSIAKDLGLVDFYAIHVMDYCWGFYEPGPVKNATVHKISMNVTGCSNPTSGFVFDPASALQKSLNDSGLDQSSVFSTVTTDLINDVKSSDLEKEIHKLNGLFKAGYILYIIAIVFTMILWLSSLIWICFGHRLAAACISIEAALAFIVMGVASALETAIAVIGAREVNKYGNDVGVSAHTGGSFMGMTWAATGCLLLASFVACAGCCVKRRSSPRTKRSSY